MVLRQGACKFGLWYVHIDWDEKVVYRVRFLKTGQESEVPVSLRLFLGGRLTKITDVTSFALKENNAFAQIYREVCKVPYGRTVTYGEIAEKCSTSPRVVGNAMAKNPTPVIIPCHRIVSAKGLGGYSPSIEIKEALLNMESQVYR